MDTCPGVVVIDSLRTPVIGPSLSSGVRQSGTCRLKTVTVTVTRNFTQKEVNSDIYSGNKVGCGSQHRKVLWDLSPGSIRYGPKDWVSLTQCYSQTTKFSDPKAPQAICSYLLIMLPHHVITTFICFYNCETPLPIPSFPPIGSNLSYPFYTSGSLDHLVTLHPRMLLSYTDLILFPPLTPRDSDLYV